MTAEAVDKSLIERLILEHSDRLQLEVNQKARADAWKFYYRVRVDTIVRPFAVCKVCFRVLHCDSRSGTASLLRHPCNPLSERSPVNRAVKLSAKLNLPQDKTDGSASPDSPATTGAVKTPCPSPTSTNNRKRKNTSSGGGLSLDFLRIPHLMHPFSVLANATALLADPHHFHHLHQLQQQTQFGLLTQEEQKISQEDAEDDQQQRHFANNGLPDANCSTSDVPLVKRERADTGEYIINGEGPPDAETGTDGTTWNKVMVQVLINSGSPRVTLADKDPAGAHHISGVWTRFSVVYVDGVLRPFAACKSCHKVVTYTKHSGTGGLLRHKCTPHLRGALEGVKSEAKSPPPHAFSDPEVFGASSPLSLIAKSEEEEKKEMKEAPTFNSTSAMAGLARAMLKYMCQDLVPPACIDSPAFQLFLWTVLNLGAAHGTFREEEVLPTSHQLLENFLEPVASDSRAVVVQNLEKQSHLSLSVHCHESLVALCMHSITRDFALKNQVLGVRQQFEGGVVGSILRELSPVMERQATIVSDTSWEEMGGVHVPCVWHAVECVLEDLQDQPSYLTLCEQVEAVLSFLADSGVYPFHQQEIHRWAELLHALTFLTAHYDELKVLLGERDPTAPSLGDLETYAEIGALLGDIRRCVLMVRDPSRPTLNQAVPCRAKLLQVCDSPSLSATSKIIKEFLAKSFQERLVLGPLHFVASFLDPRFKSLKVLDEMKRTEVHGLVLEMMKAMEANCSGVLNLAKSKMSPSHTFTDLSSPTSEVHPFKEYMDNHGVETLVSSGEEIISYVSMKIHLEEDDILKWWGGSAAVGLPTLRTLARRILAVPATCSFAHQASSHAIQAKEKLGVADSAQLNSVLHVKYNLA